MLPFFAIATTLDPYNVEAILTSAYWLNAHFGKLDEAIDVLKKGLKDNPDSWEIAFNLGTFYYKLKKDYAQSETYYLLALEKSSGQDVPKHVLTDLHYYLAEGYSMRGENA